MKYRTTTATLLVAGFVTLATVETAAQGARTVYSRALDHERDLRKSRKASLENLRDAVAAYEGIARRYPASGYTDNALWQGANLSLLAFDRFGHASDLRTALRMLERLFTQYPSSSLAREARQLARQRDDGGEAVTAVLPPPATPTVTSHALNLEPPADARTSSRSPAVSIKELKRTQLPDGIRISIEMDRETTYHAEQLDNPRRVFFDLKGARPSAALQDASLKFPDDIVRQIRVGRHPSATRIVMDMEGAESYSVFTLYDPFRLVVDFKRAAAGTNAPAPPPIMMVPVPPVKPQPAPSQEVDATRLPDVKTLPQRPLPTLPTPSLPSANRDGKFSLARQLGLGVSRIVIDAGHGGHDPGATSNGLTEADLTLDVAQRLARLLEKQQGVEVVMTRSKDTFIPLEERTAIANREGADLFLSIHANASRNTRAHGVETYFLNFATNPDAEAVAARENAGSAQSMHNLPAIVKAIALNNKLDESKDFAAMVQKSMVQRLSTRNRQLRDLGVKQAPFVVLIGAAMPSVLAEIAFVTNKYEGSLLKTGAYRQHIAEALHEAVLKYQQSLKKMRAASTAEATTK